MSVVVTPVIGLPQHQGWGQVLEAEQCSLVVVLAIQGENAGNVGRDLADQVHEAVVQTAADLHRFLSELATEVADKDCVWSVAALLRTEDTAMLAASSGLIVLKRAGKVGRLLDQPADLVVVEGSLQPEDVLVLATQQSKVLLDEIQQKLIQGYDVDTIVTSIVPGVHGLADSAGIAIAFVGSTHTPSPTQASPVSPVPVQPPVVQPSVEEPSQPPVLVTTKKQPQPWTKLLQLARVSLVRIADLAKFRQPVVYVSSSPSRQLARRVIPLAIVMVLIGGLVGNWYINRNKAITEAQAQLEPIRVGFNQAKETFATDPIVAREQAQALIAQLEQMKGAFEEKPAAAQQVAALQTEITTYYQEISGREAVQTLPQFYDLRLANAADDFITTAADLRGELAYFLDGERRQVIRLNLANKQQQVYDLGEGAQLKDIAALDDGAIVLGEELIRLTQDTETEPLILRPAEDELRSAERIDVFGQNAYVVAPADRTIYRYQTQEEGGYDDPSNWLQTGGDFTFDTVLSLQIDSDIWMTNAEGQLARFRSGRPREFQLRGVPGELGQGVRLFTTEESEVLYLLDPDNERLVIANKDGDFQREISSGSLAAGSHLIVSEEVNTAFVVSGATVFSIELGQE